MASTRRLAGLLFAVVSSAAAGFQLALALGAPWGAYAMGGANPGTYPTGLRLGAIAQAGLLLFLAAVVLAGAEIAFPRWRRGSRRLGWFVAGFAAISLLLNLITPSAGERLIWAPVALIMLITSATVAAGRSWSAP